MVVTLFTALSQWGCQPAQQDAVDPASQDISIQEARGWIDTQKSGARLGADGRKVSRNEYWNDAQKLTFINKRPVVVVPLTFDYEQLSAFIGADADKKKAKDAEEHVIQSKLLVYKDDTGKMQADVIDIIPTEDDRSKNKKVKGDSFSGYVLTRTQNGAGLGTGWVYEKGKLTGSFTPTAKGGRTVTCVNISIVQTYYDGMCGCPAVFIIDSFTFCPMEPGGGQPSGQPGGNGNGGANGPNGSGGGGFTSSGGQPSNPILNDPIILNGTPVERFFRVMQFYRSPSIVFSNEEKALINEFPALVIPISDYIEANGNKPDINKIAPPVRTIKVVGRDAINEETDFRLYPNRADAYAYLENATRTKDKELGAYLTDKGVIIGPNSEGSREHYVLIRQLNTYSVSGYKLTDYSKEFLNTTNMGTVNISGYIHTHISNYSIYPSGDDISIASFGYAKYFIFGILGGQVQVVEYGGGGLMSIMSMATFTQSH